MRVYRPTGVGRVQPSEPQLSTKPGPAPKSVDAVLEKLGTPADQYALESVKKVRRTAHRSKDGEGPVNRPLLRFVVVGGITVCRVTGLPKRVTGLELAKLYGLNVQECILCDDLHEAFYNTIGLDMTNYTVLGVSKGGEYPTTGRVPASA
jgi:hypothetical protein